MIEREWKSVKQKGDVPTGRQGHTLVQQEKLLILFGGLVVSSETRKLITSNDVYFLKMGGKSIEWFKKECNGELPVTRSHHSACMISKEKMVIFGGYHKSNIRLNDTHILELGNTCKWKQPPNQPQKNQLENQESKIGSPDPRAHHSAIYVPSKNNIYYFGGHGGVGYERKSYNDLYIFDCDSYEWSQVEPNGSPPHPRGSHVSGLLPNGVDFFIQGGWNNVYQFKDLFVFKVEQNTWSQVNIDFEKSLWNHNICVISALPKHKMFIFGGSACYFEEGQPRTLGSINEDILFFDWDENSESMKVDKLCQSLKAPRRENGSFFYDINKKQLMIYGGWSNKIYGDMFSMDIGDIIGPNYAIYSIKPEIGPVTGETECVIKGEGFQKNISYYVRFQYEDQFKDAKAQFQDEVTLSCKTPVFKDIGPFAVTVKLFTDFDDLTITQSHFNFFLNTSPDKTMAFGSGLLRFNNPQLPTKIFIQAKNSLNENRKSGKDQFEINIKRIEGEEIEFEIKDYDNGIYEISFGAEPCLYEVSIKTLNEDGNLQEIRGSPWKGEFKEGSNSTNELSDNLIAEYIENKKKDIREEALQIKKSLDKSKDNMTREEIKEIKTSMMKLDETYEENILELKIMEQMIVHGAGNEKEKEVKQKDLRNLIEFLEETKQQRTNVERKSQSTMKQECRICKEEIDEFERDLKNYNHQLKKKKVYQYDFGVQNSYQFLDEARGDLENFKKQLDEYENFAEMFEFEQKVKKSRENYQEVVNQVEILKKIWEKIEIIQETFQQFMELTWSQIKADEMQETSKTLFKELKTIKGIDRKTNFVQGVIKEIQNWNLFLPILEDLKKDYMEVEDNRHWKEFQKIIGEEIEINDSVKVLNFWNFNLISKKNKEQIEELTEKASQEKKIEKNLLKIEETWKGIEFLLIEIEQKNLSVKQLKMDDEHVEILDEQQLLIQSISSNKNMQYYEKRVYKIQQSLSNVNETIKLLSDVQKQWCFLINLFIYSQEVKKELPQESLDFEKIHEKVIAILQQGNKQINVYEFCNEEKEGQCIMHKLEQISNDLNACQKGLNDFIAKKRKVFPRFYFLTMEELLDILANGNNPVLLFKDKNYMNKIVYAADKLTMEEKGGQRPKITEMTASVGVECVKFVDGGIVLEGKVENYLQDILSLITNTIKQKAVYSMDKFKSMERVEWIEQNYAQLNLLINNIMWVEEVEEIFEKIQKGEKNALQDYFEIQKARLIDLIKLVQGSLSKPMRKKLMCLITIDTHNRDVVEKLIKEGCRNKEEFHWQSQLKFYWNVEKKDAKAKIADASFWYQYEYLGNGSRLVITPLTDRIYVTATQALHLKMGCSPKGPAGTGKTETTKDLASAFGIACYVFNCSGEMNYQTMGNIFKGLASTGCWGCFDEFNRLIPEVLSVCTVQFKSVTDAIKMKKEEFYMEEDLVHLNPTVGVFITMNPGYLGRSTLPEGLKALFRPITVVVPDLELICENILMAEGFVQAKELASKFVTLYKLCKSLLSNQSHYDWGLRAIKSVLVVAGTFKRAEPEISEQALLFRALRDFNYPKLAMVDFGIFNGLLGDLFPSIEIPRKVDEKFENHVKEATIELGLNPDPDFILQVIQLKELLENRHCVFLIGPAAAGKSETWKVLAKAKGRIEDNVTFIDLNPKVVATKDLYGYTNMKTKEWKNGLLSHYMQIYSEQMVDGKPKWIILDGDLDANWIESMNSVMDDNKLLTLANNGRIIMKDWMKMLFEIKDLKYATPATVSRAGILYISDEKGFQTNCYIKSWVKKLKKQFGVNSNFLEKLFDKYLPKVVDFMIKNCKFTIPHNFMSMVITLCQLIDIFIKENMNVMFQQYEAGKDDNILDNIKIETIFVLCVIWAYGGILTEKDNRNYKKDFSSFWKNTFKTVRFPSKGGVFDYFVELTKESCKLIEWKSKVERIDYDKSIPMNSLTIPIPDTYSIQTLSKLLIKQGMPVLYFGSSGSGKTSLMKGMLNQLSQESSNQYYSYSINFNFYTDSTSLQKMLEDQLVKQGQKFGPKKGQNKKLIFFIDDLNMPELDTYNTQSAIALLRQHVDYSHWFDISKNIPALKDIINTQVVAAMNPSAGSFFVNERYQRHFWNVAISSPSQNSKILIYDTFLKGHFKKFKSIVQDISSSIIKAAISLHDKVQKNFRKTAKNFHYEFSIRHLSSVFQGIMHSLPSQFNEPVKVVKLWIHESERVYGDRLVSEEDLKNFKKLLFEVVKKNFSKYQLSKYFSGKNPQTLIINNFPNGYQNEKHYDLVDFEECRKNVEEALRDYNETCVEMNLVLFNDAIQHVCKINRIISTAPGHALLVGVGGSGKQSLAKLAAFICEYSTFQITVSSSYSINNFKEDLINLFFKTGVKDDGILFLINENQITDEKFLVYINDLLSSGEVAGMYTEDDKMNIINQIRPKVKALGLSDAPDDCWKYFLRKVSENLHIGLCFSPVGDMFKQRARKFPALINCTQIDWFQPWPEEALLSVSQQFIKEIEIEETSVEKAVIDFMPYSFQSANKIAQEFYKKEKRLVYTTPKTFLEQLNLFKTMLDRKKIELTSNQDTYELGLVKLEETEEKVAELQANLKIIQVDVDKKKAEADKVAQIVGTEKAKVEKQSEKAKKEEENCVEIKKKVEIQRTSCEEDVKKLTPLVNNAKEKLQSLNVKEIQQLKAMPQPPSGVEKVFQCILYMFAGVKGYDKDIELTKNKLPKNIEWKSGCFKLMKEPKKLIDLLMRYPVEINNDNVPRQNFLKIKPFFKEKIFIEPDLMFKKSTAAGNILVFITCMVQYYDAMTQMIPKREALKSANNKLSQANTDLAKVKKEVAQLEADLAILVEKFDKATEEKNQALQEANRCQNKLTLAQRLVNALSSEKGRWKDNIQGIESQISNIIGDVLMGSSFISYAGPFNKFFRKKLIENEFSQFFRKKNIPQSKNQKLLNLLIDEAQIAEWNTQGLPSDQVSLENGVIMTQSERYPLIIDPQLQGITWILEKEQGIEKMRVGQKNYLFKLEQAIQEGKPFIFENLEEKIDPMVMPVICRKTFKRSGKNYLKFSGKDVLVHPDFQLYLQTKLSNPEFPPEIQAETTLINFTVTQEGLADQLLSLVVSKERPDLSNMKKELIAQQNQFKIKLKSLEVNLLDKLKNLDGEFLEDEGLINNLESSQKFSIEIRNQVAVAQKTEREINETSESYRNAAERGSLVFFIMNDLHKINSFYVYSLESFIDVVERAIKIVQDSHQEQEEQEVSQRVKELINSITYQAYDFVRQGLFEEHKVTFASLLCLKILIQDKVIQEEEMNHLIQGKVLTQVPKIPEKISMFLDEQSWINCKSLEYIEQFKDFGENLDHDYLHWKKWYQEEKVEEIEMPKKFKNLSQFHKLLVIKSMRPDRVSSSLNMFVGTTLGQQYINQQPFDINDVFSKTSKLTPIFFVLFPGVDPTVEIEKIGKLNGKSIEENSLYNISMGQGQEEKALKLLRESAESGKWIFLQNVHLMQSWLKDFERELDQVLPTAHEDFRLFISSEPPTIGNPKIIPENILQKCIKISNEAPKDIKANMRRALAHFNQERIDTCQKPEEFKNILYGLCFFHSLVLGRKKFGKQGWSANYNFNDGDLTICADVLQNYLDNYGEILYEDLRYIYGEIMYGGHITDDWDRRTNNTYLKCLIKEEIMNNMNLIPNSNPIYRILDPKKSSFQDYMDYIEKLPKESPMMFGMHNNAEINYLTKQCTSIFNIILDIQGSDQNSNVEGNEKDFQNVQFFLEKLPKELNILKIKEIIESKEEENPSPFDIFCLQESEKMNSLLMDIKTSLLELKQGLLGALNMSDSMDQLNVSLKLNRVPVIWGSYYSSEKQLMSWFEELQLRNQQLQEWSEFMEMPKSVCLSYLFKPMSFLTAIMQVTARKSKLPLDDMTLQTYVTNFKSHEEVKEQAEEGAYVHGFILEGAAWEPADTEGYLIEQKPKDLHPKMPVIHIKAVKISEKRTEGRYECPVYYTAQRGPTFIFTADLKMESYDSEESQWILGGVCLILNEN